MSTQHTPGPWEANLDAHGRGRIKGNGCWVATTWTTADDDSDKRHPAEANARLIAASPDLLEVLQSAERAMSTPHAFEVLANDSVIREMIRAAITKATGETK